MLESEPNPLHQLPPLLSHRGRLNGKGENTIALFQTCVEANFGFETDFRIQDKIWLHHDPISALSIDSNTPSLDQFVDFLLANPKPLWINLELKEKGHFKVNEVALLLVVNRID